MRINLMKEMSNATRGGFCALILTFTVFVALLSFSPQEIRANAKSGETYNETRNVTTLKLVAVEIGTGKPLSGATFGIYEAASGRKVDEITTGESGVAHSLRLSDGAYYLTEWLTPDGYKINAAEIYFYIKAGEIKQITVTHEPEEPEKPNAANGYIRLITHDENTGAILPGAAFGIYTASTGEKAAELITGEDGTAKSPALPAGDYYLLELNAPAGYRLKSDRIKLRLDAWETKEITVTNTPCGAETQAAGILNLFVKAETTGVKLSGAVFGIYNAATNDGVSEIVTGTDGLAICELPDGSYYLLELEAPSGFDVNSECLPFTISGGAAVKLDITNTAAKGGLKVINKSISGEAVESAVFGIFNGSTGARIAELATGADGAALFTLPSGVYFVVQEHAPDGYTLNREKHSFFVTSGQTITIQIYNRRDAMAATENNGVRKAGESLPYRDYALLDVIAVLCGVALFKRNKREQA